MDNQSIFLWRKCITWRIDWYGRRWGRSPSISKAGFAVVFVHFSVSAWNHGYYKHHGM